MMRSFLSTFAAMAIGIVASLFIGEMTVRAYNSLRTTPLEASSRVDGPYMQYHSIRGFALAPKVTAHMTGSEYDVLVRINEAGLRMDREVPLARTPGVPRVLFLGDSFTFGHAVEAQQRFSDLIQQDWPEAEILNFGVSGTGTDQELLHFREEGAPYAPDLVVLGFYVKCAKRNAEVAIRTPRGWRPKPRFQVMQGSLMLTNVPVPDAFVDNPEDLESLQRDEGAAGGAKRFLRKYSRLYVFLRDDVRGRIRQQGSKLIYPEYDPARPEWQVTAAIIKEMASEVRGSGARFAVAFFPSIEELDRNASTQPRDQMRELCDEIDVAFLDLLPTFLEEQSAAAARGATLYFPIDQHWTPEGHKLAARQLLPWVKALATRTPASTSSPSS